MSMANKKITFDPSFEEIDHDDLVPGDFNKQALLINKFLADTGEQIVTVPESGDPEMVIGFLDTVYKIFEANAILRHSIKDIREQTTEDGKFKAATIEGLEFNDPKSVENLSTEKDLISALTKDLVKKFTTETEWKDISDTDRDAILLAINKIRTLVRFRVLNPDGTDSEMKGEDFRKANNIP